MTVCAERISVIVPVYKVEAYLDKCVSSIVNQTYKNLEIILVDDGSPDNCGVMCDAWAKRDSRIRVIHKENGGLSDARNAGMAAATGALMGFVDSDDSLHPEMYRRLYDNMQENGSDIAACGVEMVWEDETPSRPLTRCGCCVMATEEAMRASIEESWLKQPVWYKLYKTELIRDIPFAGGKCHEDVFWTYQAVARAKRVSVFDTVGYYYLQRGGSIMGEGYSLKRLDAVEAKVQRHAYVEQRFPDLAALSLKNLWFTCIYQGQLALRALGREEAEQAMQYLNDVLSAYPRSPDGSTVKEKIWLLLAGISLSGTCNIRNALNIGQ